MVTSAVVDPTRFHIEDSILYVGDQPIPWAQTLKEPVLDQFLAEIPFESGDRLLLDWSIDSYSDNYVIPSPDAGLEHSPRTVEIKVAYAGENYESDISQGWVGVPQVLTIINTLAAPRGGMFTSKTRSFIP